MKRWRDLCVSVAVLLAGGIFSFVGAWQVGWLAVDSRAAPLPASRPQRGLGGQLELVVCTLVGALPNCPPRLDLIAPAANREGRSYRELFASLPDLKSALAKLRWTGGDAVEAARLLSLVKSLELGRYRQSYGVGDQLASFVSEVWPAHPEIVMGSSCIDCGSIARSARSQLKAHPTPPAWGERFAAGHPVNLTALADSGTLAAARILPIAAAQAELFHPGDPTTARTIGDVLVEHRRYDALLAWATNGLHGASALAGVEDLSQLPIEVVEGAWQRGVRIGDHPIRLTGFLLERGHRPALRWSIWVLDGRAEYIRGDRASYHDLMRRLVDFPPHPGLTLAQFYAANWRDIAWDPGTRTWRVGS